MARSAGWGSALAQPFLWQARDRRHGRSWATSPRAATRRASARRWREKTSAGPRTTSTTLGVLDRAVGRHWSLADRRERYAAEAVRALRYAFCSQLKTPAAALTRADVVRVLDNVAKGGRSAMASRTAAYGRACYQWAIKRGSLSANPFQNLPLATVVKRERVLTVDELRAIWMATEGRTSFNAIVRTLLLTGQRREEVAAMGWGDVAVDLSAWTIRGARAKNGVEHIVPLSPQG